MIAIIGAGKVGASAAFEILRYRIMSVSTCPSGEYGCSDYSIGVPVVLGKNGVEKNRRTQAFTRIKTAFRKLRSQNKNRNSSTKRPF